MTQHDGFAGASAHRESVRLAGLRGAIGAPRSASSDAENWRSGALGERLVGGALDDLIVDGVRVVHDRRVPGSSANIDHIAVARSGVYVVDAKNHVGRPRVDTLGGPGATVHRLYLGRDDHTHLVHGVRHQVRVVNEVLTESSVPVRGILCFAGASWDVVNGYLIDGVGVTSLAGLSDLLRMPGPLGRVEIEALDAQLRASLDPA